MKGEFILLVLAHQLPYCHGWKRPTYSNSNLENNRNKNFEVYLCLSTLVLWVLIGNNYNIQNVNCQITYYVCKVSHTVDFTHIKTLCVIKVNLHNYNASERSSRRTMFPWRGRQWTWNLYDLTINNFKTGAQANQA